MIIKYGPDGSSGRDGERLARCHGSHSTIAETATQGTRLRVPDEAEQEMLLVVLYFDDERNGPGDAFLKDVYGALEAIEPYARHFVRLETIGARRNIPCYLPHRPLFAAKLQMAKSSLAAR